MHNDHSVECNSHLKIKCCNMTSYDGFHQAGAQGCCFICPHLYIQKNLLKNRLHYSKMTAENPSQSTAQSKSNKRKNLLLSPP